MLDGGPGAEPCVSAPEFFEFLVWAMRTNLMFAEAASWNRRIHFARPTGGHCAVLHVACDAERRGIRRLVLAPMG